MEISRQTKIVCHVKNRLRSFNLLTLSFTKNYFETVATGIKQSFLLFFNSEYNFCLPEFTPCSRMKNINTIRQDLKQCMFTPPPIFHGMARVCFFLFMFHLFGAETKATTFDNNFVHKTSNRPGPLSTKLFWNTSKMYLWTMLSWTSGQTTWL